MIWQDMIRHCAAKKKPASSITPYLASREFNVIRKAINDAVRDRTPAACLV